MSKTATVLGAGIQGVCVALMLEKHGYQVQLIDKNQDVINRSSLTYEGKIHLGFVYGLDRTLSTGHKMIEDALHFAPYLDYLLGSDQQWSRMRSKPNVYLVERDSMLSPKETEAYFEKLDLQFQQSLQDERLHYLGERPRSLFERRDIPGFANPDRVSAAFSTVEVSADQLKLKNLLKNRLYALPSIHMHLGTMVKEIKDSPCGLEVLCQDGDDRAISFRSDVVFNCLWESRIRFDCSMGIDEGHETSIRLKYGLVVKADDFLRGLDSFTVIHGAYGNFVINPYDDTAFCSWYPACLKGIIGYGQVPADWERACDGEFSDALIEELRTENFKGFSRLIPGLNPFELLKIKAGLILAEGNKDITEKDSCFHSRNEVPIRQADGYYSISTSKYTSAPRNTWLLEQRLFSSAGMPR